MSIRDERREAAIERMADHLLREGLGGASLRPLAAAAGTSDRMLLYYFSDKDEILAATLERIAHRLAAFLGGALPEDRPLAPPDLLHAVRAAADSPDVRPYLTLWLELAAGAARGTEPHRAIAGGIAEGFRAWVAARLALPAGADRAAAAALVLGTFEGLLLLESVGRRDLADAAVAAFADRWQPGAAR